MINKFSKQYRAVLQRANELMQVRADKVITPTDLLDALVQTRGSIAFELLHKLGLVQPGQAAAVSVAVVVLPDLHFSTDAKKIIQQSVLVAAKHDHQYVSTEHLLHGLVKENQELVQAFLAPRNYKLQDFKHQLNAVMRNTSKFKDLTSSFSEADPGLPTQQPTRTRKRKKKPGAGNKDSLLDFFAVELTSSGQQDRIKPVIGRDKEIARIIQILARLDKNNPVLLGEPGVGKTAIIEGLAKKIVAGDVPEILANKKIFSLDLSLLVAGAMYRGEFESRLKQLLDEIREDDDIIVFVDELHNIVGAGSASGTMDAANILKPALARGEIRLIGATTFEEYKKHIEADAALERRLQPVVVPEPSVAETITILKGVRSTYERHHGVKILNEALESAAELSHRYQPEKNLPDKAIDLIDEAAAKVKIKQGSRGDQQTLRKLEQRLQDVAEQKRAAVEGEDFPRALALKEEERGLHEQLDLLEFGDMVKPVLKGKIGSREVAELISQITNIPVGELMSTEVKQLQNLENKLNKRIVGQSEAIETLAQAIKRSKTGLGHPDKPLGSFMFMGPSGVGKTETAKVLAEEVFGNSKALIRFDMSEFAEGFNVSRLIGSPAGYVGYREGGQLTESVRRRPYSVVLFDEIEKAHSEIFNILLQILDEGHLTDATGKQVDFKNTIIILTSNIGLSEFNRGAQIGFDAAGDDSKSAAAAKEYDEIKQTVMESVKKRFRPEFLNRLDKLVVFKPLQLPAIKKIVSLELERTSKQAKEKKLYVKADNKLVNFISEKSFTPREGARAVRRHLQDLVMSPLADKLLAGEIDKSKPVKVSVEQDKVVFSQ